MNVNGLARNKKRTRIFNYLKNLKADIFCIQETHGSNKTTTDRWTSEWEGQAFWSHGTHKSRGTAILVRPNLNATVTTVATDIEGRVVSIILNYEEIEINIISIYAPTDDTERRRFFLSLQQYPKTTEHVIVAGDFNCIGDLNLDKDGGNPLRGLAGNAELLQWTTSLKLADLWRIKHPKVKSYTWHNTNHTIRTRIDKFFINEPLTDQAQTTIEACPYSDHDAVAMILTIPTENPRGPGVWKLNVNILKDKQYKHEMNCFLKYWITQEESHEDTAIWWDDLKEQVKRISIKHTVRKVRERRAKKDKLSTELNGLRQANQPDNEKIRRKENELQQILNQETEGHQIRSRAQWIEQGEKPTSFFYGLEKTRQKSGTITRLKKESTTITKDVEILEEAREFYQQLYTVEPTNLTDQTWLLQHIEKELDDTEKESCEGPMTIKETTRAVSEMNNNKSPGPDGLPIEFYKQFWEILKQPLTDLYNYNYENEKMTESQQSAFLKLLYKRNDKELLKNWRPISLLNVDYKIAAKVIATRLKPVLHKVINEDQTCGIPGRSIYENIFKMRDIVHHTHKNKNQAILINLDQEKAFDRVDREFLGKTLDKMNFGPSFKNWIRTLYFKAKCTIMNNGWESDPVTLQRGLRQGCPLSPLLYVLIAESLAQAIRHDHQIQGIHIPGGNGSTEKITQYADDATLILKDEMSVQRSFDIITRYEQGSGSKLNYDKCEGIFIGAQEGRNNGPVPINWKTDYITVLGTRIGPTLEQDWETPTKKLKRRLQGWSSRALTIFGRALILRTFGIANFIFLASIFSIPEKVVVEVHRAAFVYLWKSKSEYVKRETLHLPLKEGGLAIPDLRRSNNTMKTKWLRQIGDKEYQRSWIKWPRYYIGTSLSTVKTKWSFLSSNLLPHADPNNIPSWYRTIERTAKKYAADFEKMKKEEITNRNLQTLLRTNEEPRANKKWKKEHHIQKPEMKHHWKELWKTMNTNREKETMWRLTHKILPTMERLAKWQRMGVKNKCPYCKEVEDLSHAFTGCNRNAPLWTYVSQLLEKIQGTNTPKTLVEIVFNTTTTDTTQRKLVKYITTTATTVIWDTRAQKIKGEKEQNILEEFKRRVRERIEIDIINNKRLNLTVWSYNNVLVTVNGDHFVQNM